MLRMEVVAPEVPLLQTYVDGLDRVLGGGIPKGSTVLIAGTPGTMKTSLILWMMQENGRAHGVKSLYISLEQDMDSLKAGRPHGDGGAPRVHGVRARHGPAPPRAAPRGVDEGMVHDPHGDREGGGRLKRLPSPRDRQPRGPLRALGPQDPATRDVPLPRIPQGARPDDVPNRGDALRLEPARPVGGGLPRRRYLAPAPGRGRRDGGPAAPAVRQDALDEPRQERPCAPSRWREILRL